MSRSPKVAVTISLCLLVALVAVCGFLALDTASHAVHPKPVTTRSAR